MDIIIENVTEPDETGTEIPLNLSLNEQQLEAVVSAGITKILSDFITSDGISGLSFSNIEEYKRVFNKIKNFAEWYIDKFKSNVTDCDVSHISISDEGIVDVLYTDHYTVNYNVCSFPIDYLFKSKDEIEKIRLEQELQEMEEKELKLRKQQKEAEEKEFSEFLRLKNKYENNEVK